MRFKRRPEVQRTHDSPPKRRRLREFQSTEAPRIWLHLLSTLFTCLAFPKRFLTPHRCYAGHKKLFSTPVSGSPWHERHKRGSVWADGIVFKTLKELFHVLFVYSTFNVGVFIKAQREKGTKGFLKALSGIPPKSTPIL